MGEHITYRREDDGRWRWLYNNPEAEVELRSSKTYPTGSEARRAAAELYPGVALAEIADPPVGEDELALGKLLRQAAVSLTLLAILFRLIKGAGEREPPDPAPPRGRRGQHRGLRLGGDREGLEP